MMRETGIDETATVIQVDVSAEVYLRHKEDPLHLLLTFCLSSDHLTEAEDPVERFMEIAQETVNEPWNLKSSRFILSNDKWDKYIIDTSEIQAVTLHAPALDDIMRKLEEL